MTQQLPPINPPGGPYPPYPNPQHARPPQPPKKHTTRNVLLIIAAVLFGICLVGTVATAVSSAGKKATTTTTATRSAAPAPSATGAKVAVYNTPAQVIDVLSHAGLACGSEVPVAHPGNGAFTMSQCGEHVVISTYANPAAAAASRDALSAIMKDSGFSGFAVTFGNILINAGPDQVYAQKVADLFHGTLTPIGGAKPSPTKPAVPAIEDGTWTVGDDIPAGTYRATANVGADCYWEISKSGTNGNEIIANDFPGGGRPQVTLKVGQDFTSHRCGTWHKVG